MPGKFTDREALACGRLGSKTLPNWPTPCQQTDSIPLFSASLPRTLPANLRRNQTLGLSQIPLDLERQVRALWVVVRWIRFVNGIVRRQIWPEIVRLHM